MNRWVGKVAVVTGGSAGIGLAIMQAFVREGLTVVGLARRKDKMEESMKSSEGTGKFYARACDVTKPQDVEDAFAFIKKTLGTVHILVNNAGVLVGGTIEETKIEDLRFVLDVNVMGVLYCTKQAIKLMKENGGEGHIVNINSLAGHRLPLAHAKSYNIYSATKFALRAISETLKYELIGGKIRVSNISPGLTKTDIMQRGDGDITVFDRQASLNSEDVANSVLHVVGAPFHVQISELIVQPTGTL